MKTTFSGWLSSRAGFTFDSSHFPEDLIPHPDNSDIWCSSNLRQRKIFSEDNSLRVHKGFTDPYQIVAILQKGKRRILYFTTYIKESQEIYLAIPIPKKPDSPEGIQAVTNLFWLLISIAAFRDDRKKLNRFTFNITTTTRPYNFEAIAPLTITYE